MLTTRSMNISKALEITRPKPYKDALAQMLSDNEEIIEPRSLSIKTKSYAITMKENIMQEIDTTAKELGISRSAFLAISAKNYIRTLQ